MNELISKIVVILRKSPDASDEDIYVKAKDMGIEPEYAAFLVGLIPLAYGRLMLTKMGVTVSQTFRRRQRDGTLADEQMLASEPLWKEVTSFAAAEQQNGVPASEVLAIAARSAEIHAVNELLKRGVDPRNIALTPVVFQSLEADTAL